mgnify:CR=1 FL=1
MQKEPENYDLEELTAYPSVDHEKLVGLCQKMLFWLSRLHMSLLIRSQIEDQKEREQEYRVVGSLILMAMIAAKTILKSSSVLDLSIIQNIVTARSFFETCLNAAFIASDESGLLARRSDLHAIQKLHRGNNREFTIGDFGFKITGSRHLQVDKKTIEEALNTFTRRNGKEITSWCEESVDDRIAALAEVDRTSQLMFAGARGQIYREASEIVHGTYYAYLFGSNGADSDGIVKNLENQSLIVFSTLLLCSAALAKVIEKKFGVKLGKILESIADEMSEIESIAEALKD